MDYLKSDQMKAIMVVDGRPVLCSLFQHYASEEFDVAVLAISTDDGTEFEGRLAIDLAAPNVGDEIAILTHESEVALKDGVTTISQQFKYLTGTVTEVVQGKRLPGQSFVFRTTIPVKGGMSGSPVLKKPVEGQDLIAVGVVSSDFSTGQAFLDTSAAGHSFASMIWPTMGFAVEAGEDDHPPAAPIPDRECCIYCRCPRSLGASGN